MKYSGADWIKKSKCDRISGLGTKVADVLGQVDQGIYHLEENLNYTGTDWQNEKSIQIPFSQELATFDFPRLTLLVLCCKAANLSVSISGFSRHAVRLTFSPAVETNLVTDLSQKYYPLDILGIAANFLYFQIMESYEGFLEFKISDLNFRDLIRLVQLCHTSCVRGSISAKSNRSIKIRLHQRSARTGSTFERHPDMKDAIEILKPYWEALR